MKLGKMIHQYLKYQYCNKGKYTAVSTIMFFTIVVTTALGQNIVETNLTNNQADDRYGSYSPDGKKIIFESNRDGNWEIYIMDSDGSNQQRLTQRKNDDRRPAWHPDGDKVIFESILYGKFKLFELNIENKKIKEINTHKFYKEPIFAKYSPDGKMLAFSNRISEDKANIVIIDETGKEVITLADYGYRSFYPSWTPDSKTISFFSRHETNNHVDEIYRINIDGTMKTRLTNWHNHNFCPTFSSDGSKIVYVTSMDNIRPEIYIMESNGSNQTRITYNEDGDTLPCWSPDNKKLVITGYRNGNFEIIELANFDSSSVQ